MFLFFDQNVIERLLKKQNESFISIVVKNSCFYRREKTGKLKQNKYKNNIDRLLQKKIHKDLQQLFTPFSLMEFSWLNRKKGRTLDIKYKNKNFNEYPFKDYQELSNEGRKYLEKELRKKITSQSLKESLNEKKQENSKWLNEQGKYYIDKYIEKVDIMYDDLIINLVLDKISQVNISKFSNEDKIKFRNNFTCIFFERIAKKQLIGSFRIVYILFDVARKLPVAGGQDSEFYKVEKEIPKILENLKLKSKGDLIDCELPHLFFFGFKSKQKHDACYIYTTDKEKDIIKRLKLYKCFIDGIMPLFYEEPFIFNNFIKDNDPFLYDYIKNKNRPEWKFGEISFLNQETGEEIKKISVSDLKMESEIQ